MIFWSIIKLPINLIFALLKQVHLLELKYRSYPMDLLREIKNYKIIKKWQK